MDANYPSPSPELTVGWRALGGGGCWEGSGGGSGTSEQLGMRPKCDPTIRTAPSHKRGRGIIGLGIPSHTGYLSGVGPQVVRGPCHKTYIHAYILLLLATLKCHSGPPPSPITLIPLFLNFSTQK